MRSVLPMAIVADGTAHGWSLSLQPVAGGTALTEEIDASEFFGE